MILGTVKEEDRMTENPQTSKDRWILSLSGIGPEDRVSAGNKAWYLGRLANAGFDVPPAIVIAREASLAALRGPGGEVDPGILRAVLDRLRSDLPGVLRLEEGIAVRSSSSAEDTLEQSMAGQFATILRVKSWGGLEEAIARCWRSSLHPAGGEKGGGGIAVILQAMVEADLAGVAFSRDPSGGGEDTVAIEFTDGTAERLVSAEIAPSSARVRGEAVEGAPSSAEAVGKHRGILLEVARLARRIEDAFGFPADVEWAAKGGRLFAIQARPITRKLPEVPPPSVPPGSWTRHIAEDLWADPLTAFEEVLLISLSPRFDLRKPSRWIGIEIPEGTRILAAIRSHLYVSCGALELGARLLPRPLRLEPIARLFPPGADPRLLPAPGILRILRAVLGALALGLSSLDANPFTCVMVSGRRARRLAGEARALSRENLSSLSPEDLKARLDRLVDILSSLLESNQFPYLYAIAFSWLVENRARTSGIPREAWLSRLGGTERNATRRMIPLLRKLGEGLREGGIETSGKSFETMLGDLERRGLEEVFRAARELLEEYGVRSGQRSLVEPRWAEAPERILEHARAFAREGPARAGEASPERGKPPGLLLRVLLRIANRYLDLREDLRFALDSVLYAIRIAILEVSRRFRLDREAFFLTPGEISSLLSGTMSPDEARRRGGERLEGFRAASVPPMFWVEGRPVHPFSGEASSNSLKGIGASPGIARGRVRVVESLEDASRIEVGEIAVAKLMGPAWAPILRFAGAVVTEKGGLLDHFAILARESGIPAVTGAEGATAALANVETATVDGTEGLVTWSTD